MGGKACKGSGRETKGCQGVPCPSEWGGRRGGRWSRWRGWPPCASGLSRVAAGPQMRGRQARAWAGGWPRPRVSGHGRVTGPCFRGTREPSARTFCGDRSRCPDPGEQTCRAVSSTAHYPFVPVMDGGPLKWTPMSQTLLGTSASCMWQSRAGRQRPPQRSSASRRRGRATSLPGGQNRTSRDPPPTPGLVSGRQRAASPLVPPCPRRAGPTRLDGLPSAPAVDGRWSPWSPWSACSVTCAGGIRERTRVCNSPEPQHGGQACVGDVRQQHMCNRRSCPVGGWRPPRPQRSHRCAFILIKSTKRTENTARKPQH